MDDTDLQEITVKHFNLYEQGFYKTLTQCREKLETELKARDAAKELEAEKRGVAWTIGIIDEMHEMDSHIRTSVYKGIKNGIRAMYEQDTGNGDPAPDYPINVTLRTSDQAKEGK